MVEFQSFCSCVKVIRVDDGAFVVLRCVSLLSFLPCQFSKDNINVEFPLSLAHVFSLVVLLLPTSYFSHDRYPLE